MTTPAGHTSGTPLIDWRTAPSEQRRFGGRSLAVGLGALVITIAVLVLAIATNSPTAWVATVVGVLALIVWGVVALNARKASTLSGDDLIEIVAGPEELRVQGGLAVTWNEVESIVVQVEDSRYHGARRNAMSRATAATTNALVAQTTGFDGIVKTLAINLKADAYPAVKARATTKMQRLVLFGPMLGGAPYVHVGLNNHSLDEVAQLEAALNQLGQPHGISVNVKA